MAWVSYQLRKIAGYACVRNAGNDFSATRHRLQKKPLVSDPYTHHSTCVTHVPQCMSGSLTRDGGENVPGIPGACPNRNFMYLIRGPWHSDYVWETHHRHKCVYKSVVMQASHDLHGIYSRRVCVSQTSLEWGHLSPVRSFRFQNQRWSLTFS